MTFARTPSCAPACGPHMPGNGHVCAAATPLGDAWCPDCRTTRPVVDRHPESHYQTGREVGYTVTDLDCGHTIEGGRVDVGPAPGGESAAEDQTDQATRARHAALGVTR